MWFLKDKLQKEMLEKAKRTQWYNFTKVYLVQQNKETQLYTFLTVNLFQRIWETVLKFFGGSYYEKVLGNKDSIVLRPDQAMELALDTTDKPDFPEIIYPPPKPDDIKNAELRPDTEFVLGNIQPEIPLSPSKQDGIENVELKPETEFVLEGTEPEIPRSPPEPDGIENVDLKPEMGFVLGGTQEESEKKVAYNQEKAMEQFVALLFSATSSGKKLGVVFGRSAEQALPKMDNVIFISFDREMPSEIAENRIHIAGDFNELETGMFSPLRDAFDVVIFDLACRKFLNDSNYSLFEYDVPMAVRPVLKKGADTILYFEAEKGMAAFADKKTDWDKFSKHGVIPFFKNNNETNKKMSAITMERDQKYFSNYFDSVGLITTKERVAYPSRAPETEQRNFFRLKGPKENFWNNNAFRRSTKNGIKYIKLEDTEGFKKLDEDEKKFII